jgi:hypothetical protein
MSAAFGNGVRGRKRTVTSSLSSLGASLAATALAIACLRLPGIATVLLATITRSYRNIRRHVPPN